jgi:hypothetical protein
MIITSLSGLRFGRFFFEIGYFPERNSNIQFVSANCAQKISEWSLMCAAPFLSPEMHALRMEKCLHVTPEMHAIYLPHEFQKTNLKWSRHHLQLLEYKFLQILV